MSPAGRTTTGERRFLIVGFFPDPSQIQLKPSITLRARYLCRCDKRYTAAPKCNSTRQAVTTIKQWRLEREINTRLPANWLSSTCNGFFNNLAYTHRTLYGVLEFDFKRRFANVSRSLHFNVGSSARNCNLGKIPHTSLFHILIRTF